MITIPNWMFISTFGDLREFTLGNVSISSLIYNGRGVWGPDFGSCAFTLNVGAASQSRGVFRRLFRKLGEVTPNDELIQRLSDLVKYPEFRCRSSDFQSIPGKPLAFWITTTERQNYASGDTLENHAQTRKGLDTGENDRFLRFWQETDLRKCSFVTGVSNPKWFPYNKGGEFRKWYGNREILINWEDDGREIKTGLNNQTKKPTLRNQDYYLREAVTWSTVTISRFSARYSPVGALFDNGGSSVFAKDGKFPIALICGLLNSSVAYRYLEFLAPTVNYQPGDVGRILLPESLLPQKDAICSTTTECISVARADWDNFETSWDFRDPPLLRPGLKGATLEASWRNWEAHCTAAIRRMQELETENNRLFIAAYGLDGELQPEVPEEQITLARADARRDIAAFLSYAIGCMMGRYRIDQPGLIYAHSGNVDFDKIYFATEPHGRNTEKKEDLSSSVSFPCPSVAQFLPDQDGIIPLLQTDWGFPDDATLRAREFLRAAFSEATLNDNLRFIEEALGKDLRKYFLTDFYKDHLQTYKKRPIYWLFSSGKQRAFQCLVYLHRYHVGTLARMRTEYVIPLQGRIAARIEQLEGDKAKATSTSFRKKLQKEQDDLKKQQAELLTFEEKLKHAADQKIRLDLDDGVKVNYGKFGAGKRKTEP